MLSASFRCIDDFSNANIGLGDYVRLGKLETGDLIFLKDNGGGVKTILIGNASVYNGPDDESTCGWDWEICNRYKVHKVLRVETEHVWMSNEDFVYP